MNVGNRTTIKNKLGDKNTLNRVSANQNIYRHPENQKRVIDQTEAHKDLKKARPAKGRANDVFVDKNGALARPDGDQWKTLKEGKWQDDQVAIKDKAPNVIEPRPEFKDNVTSKLEEHAVINDRANDAKSNMSQRQRDQAAERIRQQAPNIQSARPSLNQVDLNRARQARSMGAGREFNRPMPRQMPHRR